MTRSERFYRTLLRLYPAEFRSEYGRLMAQCFHDLCLDAARADGQVGLLKVWLRVLPDFTLSLIREYLDSWGRERAAYAIPGVIDRFQVKAQIGDGSVSRVYRAYDPDRKVEVAIKLLKRGEPEPDGPAGLRFEDLVREMEVMGVLDHPAIPKAYGCYQSDAGAYLVMDFIPGRSLLEVLAQREDFLPEREIISLGIRTCEVLGYLHTRRPQPMLFRDVKPSNLILDENGGFHMIDFGISVPYASGQGYEGIGTEGYAAPEQYGGCEEPRSDLYALGATLHHLATRVDPREETKRRPFTFAPPRRINPALSEGFSAVIQKALSPDLEERYPSASAMRAALEACL